MRITPEAIRVLEGLNRNTRLTRKFFLYDVYGSELYTPGYADLVINRLEELGCSNARQYYNMVVEEYERKRNEELKPVGRWLREQWEKEAEEWRKEKGGELRKQEKITLLKMKKDLLRKSKELKERKKKSIEKLKQSLKP